MFIPSWAPPFPDICGIRCIERIRPDDVFRVEADDEVSCHRLAERAVMITSVGPCSPTVLDTDPPGLAEHGLDLRLGRLAYLNVIHL